MLIFMKLVNELSSQLYDYGREKPRRIMVVSFSSVYSVRETSLSMIYAFVYVVRFVLFENKFVGESLKFHLKAHIIVIDNQDDCRKSRRIFLFLLRLLGQL